MWGQQCLTPLEEKHLRWTVMNCTQFSEVNEASVNIQSYLAFLLYSVKPRSREAKLNYAQVLQTQTTLECSFRGIFIKTQLLTLIPEASQVAQGKESACQCRQTQKTQVRSQGGEDPLEKEMATHSSILAWKIPWTEESAGLQSMSCNESDRTEHTCMTIPITSLKISKDRVCVCVCARM